MQAHQYRTTMTMAATSNAAITESARSSVSNESLRFPSSEVELHVGGLSSLASQPSASEVMGSLSTTVVSTRPHFWHSKLR